jgi:hypothetical protein
MMRGRRLELRGQRFGKLVAVRSCGKQGSNVLWLCECDCGNTSKPKGSELVAGKSKSCGCEGGTYKHGHSGTPVYTTWKAMKSRCYNENRSDYQRYGAKGIKVCDEWKYDFESFYDYMGPRDITESIDRIDSNGNYEPGNVRWVTKSDNTKNKWREQ